jgi:4-aminobutyrate aminotransferase-like enzyme
LWGIELATSTDGVAAALIAQWLVVGLLEHGIVTQVTTLAPNVVRIEPPLIAQDADIERCAAALGDVLATQATGALASLLGAGKHLLKQRLDAVLGRIRP